MQHTISIVPSQCWQHASGRQASIWGAAPWTSEADKRNWEVVTKGWTWRVTQPDGSTTEGLSRPPAKTYEEALRIAEKYCYHCGATLEE